MSAPRSWRRAAARVALILPVLMSVSPLVSARQQSGDAETQRRYLHIAAISERLASELLAAKKKRPVVLDLTLPGELPCPLGAWLADKISESMAQKHPELDVIPRAQLSSVPLPVEFLPDRNRENEANEQRARTLGAEVVVQGNFAAIPAGIGITLMASDRLGGGDSRFEVLAEIPLTEEMQEQLTSPLPQRSLTEGSYKASTAGIGSPVCDPCPPPEYTYVALAKKLSGVVILQAWISKTGMTEHTKIVTAPNPSLGNAALRAVRNWRFQPAVNASGDAVPVVLDVSIAFHLNGKQLNASAVARKSARSN